MTESFTVCRLHQTARVRHHAAAIAERPREAKSRKLRRILAGKRYRCPIRFTGENERRKRRRFRERCSPPVNKKSIIARRVRAKIPTLIAGISPHTPNLRAATRTTVRVRLLDRADRIARDGFAGIPRASACANRLSARGTPTIRLLERRGETRANEREETATAEATSFFSALLSADGLRARKVSGTRLERRRDLLARLVMRGYLYLVY